LWIIGAGSGLVGLAKCDDHEQELSMRLTKNVPGGLTAMIIFAIAALNLIFLLSELTMNVIKVYFGWTGESMLPNPVFSLADTSPEQLVAFVGFAIFTIGFFVWVAYLVRMK
jgi:hypothetical protein